MPLYTVKCQVCQKPASVRLSFAEYDGVKAGTKTLTCPHAECEGTATIEFNPGEVAFVLKDGESGGWVSKAGKENKFRSARRREMERRERDHVFKSRLQPNYGGQLTDSWKEAKEAAYEATYDKIKQEHGTQVAAQAASESAKTYDPLLTKEVGT
jgi:hypothetical protein